MSGCERARPKPTGAAYAISFLLLCHSPLFYYYYYSLCYDCSSERTNPISASVVLTQRASRPTRKKWPSISARLLLLRLPPLLAV